MDDSSVLLQQLPAYPSSSAVHFSSSDALILSRQYDLMAHLERLKEFLATAPTRWCSSDAIPISQRHPALNRFLLPSNEYVTCVKWCGFHYITGTDIVRALVFRFEAFGRPVRNMKKFEEGVFSDLRNLKPGQDACLEDPKSPFLDLLFKYQCIRTQKKQKVFYWFSVPHDRLFIDALERDLKREKIGLESTTSAVAEPALSFSYDPKRPLFQQINASTLSESRSASSVSPYAPRTSLRGRAASISLPDLKIGTSMPSRSSLESPRSIRGDGSDILTNPPVSTSQSPMSATNSPVDDPSRGNSFFNMFAFLEGTPTYKRRRQKTKSRRGGCPNNTSYNGDDRIRHSLEVHSARRSFDVAPRNLADVAVAGRHSLDSLQQGNTNSLNGSTHYQFPSRPGLQQIRVPNLPVAPASAASPPSRQALGAPAAATGIAHAPTPGYVCPLYTCRQVFSIPEQLQYHISQHAERSGGANGMDVDPESHRQQLVHTAASTTTTSFTIHPVSAPRNVSGSPETPAFSHVLTTPNGSPRCDYDYDDDSGYAPDWSQQQQHHLPHAAAKIEEQEQTVPNAVCEQPPLPPQPASPPNVAPQQQQQQQPMYLQFHQHQQAYAFDTTSVASVSSTSPCYPPPSPTYPVSAPANQLTFNIPDLPPTDSEDDPVQSRRPRSTTPPNSQPVPRATHRRRPSTATAIPTSFGGGGLVSGPTAAFGVSRSNSFTTCTLSAAQQQQQQQLSLPPSSWRIPPRGYHPYAAPEHGLNTRPSTSYSTSSAPSSQGSSSPFAVHINAPGTEYSQQSSEGHGIYLQEPHEIKYEPQEYHITREPEYVDVASEACHVEYPSEMSAAYVATGVEQTHHQEYVEDGGEYISEAGATTHQGYMSQEPSPEAQFAHIAGLAYSEDDYEVAHTSAVDILTETEGGYPIPAEDVSAVTVVYQSIPDMTMPPEVPTTYASERGHAYLAHMSSHSQQHPQHHRMLPYYQQVA